MTKREVRKVCGQIKEQSQRMSELLLKDEFVKKNMAYTSKDIKFLAMTFLAALCKYFWSNAFCMIFHERDILNFIFGHFPHTSRVEIVQKHYSYYKETIVMQEEYSTDKSSFFKNVAEVFFVPLLYPGMFNFNEYDFRCILTEELTDAHKIVVDEVRIFFDFVETTIKKRGSKWNVFWDNHYLDVVLGGIIIFTFLMIFFEKNPIAISWQNRNIHKEITGSYASVEDYRTNEYWASIKPDLHKIDIYSVYWVPNGGSYHSVPYCIALSNSENVINGTLTEAITSGHKNPCSKCVGG